MTHPAVDLDAVARLRQRAGAPARLPDAVAASTNDSASVETTTAKLKARARRAATPVVAKLRYELDRAAAGEVSTLRAEVAELRSELARTRAECAAATAALHEERA